MYGNATLPENWATIQTVEGVKQAIESSQTSPVLLLKHSTRCPISSMALNRLLNGSPDFKEQVKVYYLDLIAYRDVSNWIASELNITHQSPQAIVLKNNEVIHISTHGQIDPMDILDDVNQHS